MDGVKPRNVVVGQQVEEAKVILARRMRRWMTPTEAILWSRLRGDRLGVNFRRQQIIGGFIADFYCHSAALVVEVDGSIHDTDYDAERDRIFGEKGIRVLRVTSDEVTERIGPALSRICRHLDRAPS